MQQPRMSALWLERLALGELELTDADLQERGLEREEVEAAVAALREENARFNPTLPPQLDKFENEPASTPVWAWAMAALVALAVGLSWWNQWIQESEPSSPIAESFGRCSVSRLPVCLRSSPGFNPKSTDIGRIFFSTTTARRFVY